jgi:hypothetical protein
MLSIMQRLNLVQGTVEPVLVDTIKTNIVNALKTSQDVAFGYLQIGVDALLFLVWSFPELIEALLKRQWWLVLRKGMRVLWFYWLNDLVVRFVSNKLGIGVFQPKTTEQANIAKRGKTKPLEASQQRHVGWIALKNHVLNWSLTEYATGFLKKQSLEDITRILHEQKDQNDQLSAELKQQKTRYNRQQQVIAELQAQVRSCKALKESVDVRVEKAWQHVTREQAP